MHLREITYKAYIELTPAEFRNGCLSKRSTWGYGNPQPGWFHQWQQNSEGEMIAIIECLDGTCMGVNMEAVTFVERPDGAIRKPAK